METNNNIKDFNIAEALKFAPKGLKLYSPLFGEVRFIKVFQDTILANTLRDIDATFFQDGRYYNYNNTECLLFPSINHRCWNHWQNTLFLESIGSVCVDTITGNKFILGEDGTYFSDNTGNSYHFLIDDEDSGNYLLNSRYASPKEAKEFFDELEKNGYEWNGKMVVKSTSQPNFQEGDWVVNNNSGDVFQVTEIKDDEYCLWPLYGKICGYLRIIDVDTDYHLWTIRDAKDGDVIAFSNDTIVMFKNLYNSTTFHSYCHIEDGVFNISKDDMPDWWEGKGFYPATKEQRELLFQKMKEEGYQWNDDAKKLIKTTTPIPKFKVGDVIKHKSTGEISTIKKVCSNFYILENANMLYFDSQDMWELVASKVKPTLEEKVNILADEIIALKQRVLALEIQVIKDMSTPPMTKDPYFKSNKITCDVFETPDKAGDNVTLEEMKG